MQIKTTPILSVIMPVYGENIFIKQAIESILAQTMKNFEFIIVNEYGSENKSIQEYAQKDNRIIIIQNNRKLGLPASLNVGIKKARGKYIARMDSDDIAIPERFEKQVEYLEENTNIDICGSNIRHIDENGKYLYRKASNYPRTDELIKAYLLFTCPLAHPTVVFRTSTIKQENLLYNESCNTLEDLELWTRASNKVSFYNIKEPLLKYRVHGSSLSTKQLNQDLFYSIMNNEWQEKGLYFEKETFLLFFPQTRIINENIKKYQLENIRTAKKEIIYKLENEKNKIALNCALDRFLGWAEKSPRHFIVFLLRKCKNEKVQKFATMLEQTICFSNLQEKIQRDLLQKEEK